MEKKEFLKNLEDIRGKVNKLAIDRLNEQPDEEKEIEKKIKLEKDKNEGA